MYRDAIGYDAQFASARASRDAGLEKLPQGRAALRPMINFTDNLQRTETTTGYKSSSVMTIPHFLGTNLTAKIDPNIPDSTTKTTANSWQFNLVQPLFRWQNWSTYKQSELATISAETQYAGAKQDLIERVTQAYFDVLLAQEDLITAQAQTTAIAEQLAAAKRNFEVGTTTITDTHEAQSRFDLITANTIAAESNLQIRRHALGMLIGKEPDELKGLKNGVEISPPQPEDIGKWVESAEKDNINVLLGKSNLEIANREIEKQRTGHYPTLDLIASRARSTTPPMFSGLINEATNNTTVLGLQLNIPIYSGGMTSSRAREAVALREKAKADLENLRRIAALSARQSYLGVTSGLAQVKALEQALISSQSALDSNKLGYEVGVRVNIDVLNAQQQVFSTRRDLAKARVQTLTAQLKLKAATGSLTEQDLVAINNLME